MINLISIELYKIFSKWRTYIGFIAIGILIPLLQYAIYSEGDRAATMGMRNINDMFEYSGNIMNGYVVASFILGSLFVHIPFLLVLVGGDLMAGEATAGTFRMLVTRPVSRFQIVTSKFLAGMIYTALLIIWLAIMSLGLGVILFGTGPLISVKTKIFVFAQNDVLWRFMAAYGIAALNMAVVTSLAFLLSSFVQNAIGPIITTMAIIIVFLIVSNIPVDFCRELRPYLFTNYFGGWNYFFEDPVDTKQLFKDCAVLGAHIIGFYGLALLIFQKKDILT